MSITGAEVTSFDMLYSPNNTFVNSPCRNEMTGKFGLMVRNLISTLLLSQCALASPFMYPDDYSDRMDEENITFDFIVIGAGASGSVVTNRLTEISSWNILAIEAGGDPPMSTEVPASHYSARGTAADWNFKTEPSFLYKGLKGEVDRWSAGKVLGGSSTIGRMVYQRGRPWDYEQWSAAGIENWKWSDNLPFFEKTEEVLEAKNFGTACSFQDKLFERGTKGYQKLRKFKSYDQLPDIFIKAAEDLGYEANRKEEDDSFSSGIYHNKGTLKDGERVSAAKGYLASIKKRDNFYLLKRATVTKIIIDPTDRKAVGVEMLLANNKTKTVFAKKEVILSAGAINTPKLLMLSGIGKESHLNNFGIPVIKDAQVGENLMDHILFTGLAYTVNVTKVRPIPHNRRKLDAAYEYLTRRSGELSTAGGSIVTAHINFFGKRGYPNLQVWFELFEQYDFAGFADFAKSHNLNCECSKMFEEALKEHDLLFIMPVLLTAKSKGTVRLSSSNPLDPPAIVSGYYTHDEDVETMLMGVRFGQSLAQTYVMISLGAEILKMKPASCFDEAYDSDIYWRCMLFELTTSFNDYVGTAKMGCSSDSTAVVNNKLQVYGVKNLRVVDASVIPTAPTTNCLGPSTLIGERGADFILRDWLVGTSINTSESTPNNLRGVSHPTELQPINISTVSVSFPEVRV